MTKLRQRVVAALSAGSMFLSMALPAAAAQTTLEISGNGSQSDNEIRLTQQSQTTVNQNNSANITNNVSANANSGKNDANRNTGGDVVVDTGDAKADVKVSNAVNSNSASVDCCGANDTSVLISGNGEKSDNDVKLTQWNVTTVNQDNNAKIRNNVDADANSGKNDANRNTGGDVEIYTGKATANVDVYNTANANWAKVGGGNDSGGSVDVRILGNGSRSDNFVKLDVGHLTTLDQSNSARIYNNVDADANSGKNDANRNTGGEVLIDTGNAKADVVVDNMVNFNAADVDCGCLLDVLAKIAGNGEKSDNDIKASLYDQLVVSQDNCGRERGLYELSRLFKGLRKDGCELRNNVDADANSGKNDAERNTGDHKGGDPEIITGDADAYVDVSNSGNSNAFGMDGGFEWPDFDFNFNFSLGLSLSDLLALLKA